MKPLKRSQLIEKYWNAETNITEESELKYQTQYTNEEKIEKLYFDYVASEKYAPNMLANEIWGRIEQKKNRKIRTLKYFAVAASVAIVIGVTVIVLHNQKQQALEMQFAVIEQTLNHVSGEITSTDQQVIYEDDVIVIVANK